MQWREGCQSGYHALLGICGGSHFDTKTCARVQGRGVTWLPVRLSLRRICSTSRAGVHTRVPAGVSRLPGDAGHLATGTFSGGHLSAQSSKNRNFPRL